jgi:hypothetical protein
MPLRLSVEDDPSLKAVSKQVRRMSESKEADHWLDENAETDNQMKEIEPMSARSVFAFAVCIP